MRGINSGEQRRTGMFTSIIIPTLNEESTLPSLLSYVLKHIDRSVTEVLVVDGKSSDRTVEKAQKSGVQVVIAPERGRASQMNYGAGLARGDLLYFLHSDTYPPPEFMDHITRAAREGYEAGCFQLGFDEERPLLRFYSWFTQFDINAFRFGDQSLFVEASLFDEIGGFDCSLEVMEDNEIMYRLKNRADFKIMPARVETSARRYERNGVFRLQILFTLIYLLFHMGVSQEVLVDFYEHWIR